MRKLEHNIILFSHIINGDFVFIDQVMRVKKAGIKIVQENDNTGLI